MSNCTIAVFGSLTQDLFLKPTESHVIEHDGSVLFALPHGGKVTTEYLEKHGGGGAANVATSLSRLGFMPSIFGAIGDDDNADWIVSRLQKEGIDTSNIQRKEKTESGFSVILNAKDGERTVVFTSHANKSFIDFSAVDLESISPKALYLCHLSSSPSDVLFQKIEQYIEKNDDLSFGWNPGKERIALGIEKNKTLLKNCNFLFLNKTEAEQFTQITDDNIQHLAQPFLEAGVDHVVITLGKDGAWIFTETDAIFAPSVDDEKIDTLGAGDAFGSTFFASFLHGKSLNECMQYASINAASVVSKRGAQDGLLQGEHLYR